MAKSKTATYGSLKKIYRDDFTGGWNSFLGVRQVADNESPSMSNCDFYGKGGICNRQGYVEIGSTSANADDGAVGLGTLHTTSYHHLMRFVKNGSTDVRMEYSSDGGAWTQWTAHTFTASLDVDTCQAGGKTFMCNGSNDMLHWTGVSCATTTGGTKGYYPTYYGRRLWVKDETNPDQLNFSGQWGDAGSSAEFFGGTSAGTTDYLANFGVSAGYLKFLPGSGSDITGIKPFKNSLYVFLRNAIYRVDPYSAANVFTVTLVTNAIGCVSQRSIVQVEEDLFFAADDGVYSLGDVANYSAVRTTNKSARIKGVFDNITPANKSKLCAVYQNFKYHLFYSNYGTTNDSCIAYDIRYKGWVQWSNFPGIAATEFITTGNNRAAYFADPNNSKVYKMYTGADDNGTSIQSTWHSKSFDDGLPDIQKVYFDHTFVFGALQGTVNLTVRFNDIEVAATETLSQITPLGGFGANAFGIDTFGDAYFDTTWRATRSNISSISGSGTTVTVNTSTDHNKKNGELVVISGTSDYNGTFNVSVTDSNTFIFTSSGTAATNVETSGYADSQYSVGQSIFPTTDNNFSYEMTALSASVGDVSAYGGTTGTTEPTWSTTLAGTTQDNTITWTTIAERTSQETSITNYRGIPVRVRASEKKFAVQYKITSSGQWRLDNITTTYKPLSHYAFPSMYKV